MEQMRARVAGLDVHRDSVTACARIPDEVGHPTAYRRKFKTTTKGLGELAVCLAGHGVTTAGMEATGVYWKPVLSPRRRRGVLAAQCPPHAQRAGPQVSMERPAPLAAPLRRGRPGWRSHMLL
jgi:hypothetical protein